MAKSRVVKKFFRDKLALLSLFLVGLYMGVFLWSLAIDFFYGLEPGVVNTVTARYEAQEEAFAKAMKKGNAQNFNKTLDKLLKKVTTKKKKKVVTYEKVYLAAFDSAFKEASKKGADKGAFRKSLEAYLSKNNVSTASISWFQKYNKSEGKDPTKNKFLPPSGKHWLGTDRLGRDIFRRTIVSINIAFKIGIMTALISIFIGLVLGCISGYFRGKVDIAIQYLYTVLSSIPYILLLLLLMAIFKSYKIEGVVGIYIAFGLTFWVGIARQVRGEVMKLKELEYVQAARALGQSKWVILFKHIAPNTLHIVFVYFSLIFISAVKSEVILSFLGFGVQGMPSWGTMINAAKPEILTGNWWQLIAASSALFVLVYAFNILTDALQDALDPKHTR